MVDKFEDPILDTPFSTRSMEKGLELPTRNKNHFTEEQNAMLTITGALPISKNMIVLLLQPLRMVMAFTFCIHQSLYGIAQVWYLEGGPKHT
jgi:hypothetical protein